MVQRYTCEFTIDDPGQNFSGIEGKVGSFFDFLRKIFGTENLELEAVNQGVGNEQRTETFLKILVRPNRGQHRVRELLSDLQEATQTETG